MAAARSKKIVEEVPDTELKALAADILRDRAELKPSVDIVMNSDLDEDGKTVAMKLFQGGLDDPWDAMRNPHKAVAAARLHKG